MSRLSRRELLRLLAAAPIAVACTGEAADDDVVIQPVEPSATPTVSSAEVAPTPAPVAMPEPVFVRPAGEEVRALMAGTAYETPLYVFASGRPGKTALVLGGVHGNEPGGWQAADWVAQHRRPENGVLLVVPRANRVAISLFERTTDALADLNRSYPGFVDGKPMERMAAEIVATINEYDVNLVHDMHESWAFYKDRATNGTAFIGQTVATNGEAGTALANIVVGRVNASIRSPQEEFFFRDMSMPQPDNGLPRQTSNVPSPGRGTSSLGLNRFQPGLITLLVEMGQQQAMERRISLHIQMLDAALQELGIGTGQV